MSKLLYVSCSHGRTQVSSIGHEGGDEGRVSIIAREQQARSVSCRLDPGYRSHKLDFPNDSAHAQEPHSTRARE